MASKRTTSPRRNIGSAGAGALLLIFGLPFLAVGVGMSGMSLHTLLRYHRAKSWPEVPARILKVELRTGSSGDTYQVHCTYEYERHGHRYTGKRVGLSGGSDNIGSWQQDTHARLAAAHSANQPVPCYVNPSRPDEALLVRDLRFGEFAFLMGFATAFGSVGLGIVSAGVAAIRKQRRAHAFVRAHPGEPWLQRPDWAEGLLRPTSLAGRARIAWVFAIYWNLISLPLLFVLPPALLGPDGHLAALNLIYPLAGLGILAGAIYLSCARRKWGQSRLQLETLPGVIGGHLRGTLSIVGEIFAVDRLELELKCVKTTNQGKSATVSTVWNDVQVHDLLPVTFGQSELQIPIDFQIPASCTPTGKTDDATVEWQLTARAETPGVDLNLKFEVPVFITGDTDPNLGKTAARRAAEEAAVLADTPPVQQLRVADPAPGTRVYTCTCWPGPAMFLVVGVMFLISAGATILIIIAVARGNWSVIMPLPCCLPLALLMGLILSTLLGRHTVTVSCEGLTVRRSWGPLAYTRRIRLDEISSIQYKQSSSSNEKKWYGVRAELSNGRNTTLAGMVPGEVAARWLVQQLRTDLGLGHADEPAPDHVKPEEVAHDA